MRQGMKGKRRVFNPIPNVVFLLFKKVKQTRPNVNHC